MPRPTRDRSAAIEAALKAHQASGGDLTAQGFAKAAGITPEAVRARAPTLGLTVLSARPQSARPPPSTDPAPVPSVEGETGGSDPTTTQGPPPAPAESVELKPAPGRGRFLTVAEADSVVGAAVRRELMALEDRARAKGSPEAADGPSATEIAQSAAAERLTRAHIGEVVADAAVTDAFDKQAGQIVRQLWQEKYKPLFPEGPDGMVRTWEEFWWQNQDAVATLQELVIDYQSALQVQVDQSEPQRRVDARRSEAFDRLMVVSYNLAVQGKPLPAPLLHYMIRVCEAWLSEQPLPDPFSPEGFLPPGG